MTRVPRPPAAKFQAVVHTDPWLRGRWLQLGRIGWLVFAGSAGAMVIAGIPLTFVLFQTVCVAAPCPDRQLTVEAVQVLHASGLSVGTYAVFSTMLGIAFAVVDFAIAALLVWRRPNDRMALFTAFILVALGASNSNVPNALAATDPVWRLPSLIILYVQRAGLVPVLCLFPDGRFIPRWTRWIALVMAVVLAGQLFFPGSALDLTTWPTVMGGSLLMGSFVTILAAQIYRYRRVSTPAQCQQTKWVLYGIGVQTLVACSIAAPLLRDPSAGDPGTLYFLVSRVVWVCATLLTQLLIGLAILRARLWDIDVVINRTLVYGALSASIVGMYVFTVSALGILFVRMVPAGGSSFLALIATGLVAVLFQPLRDRIQRAVNRLMYGERDTPYAVVSRLARRLEETLVPTAVFPTIVQTVQEALKLPYAAIALKQDDAFPLLAVVGTPVMDPLRLPLIYQHEVVGQLILATRSPGETFSPADRRLLDDLARQAGVAAHAVLLHAEAIRLNRELQRSREALVTTREEERRRLRRDLHDGLGPALASLTLKVDAARDELTYDVAAAADMLHHIKQDLQGAVADIRRLVYALRPPALDDLGLVGALRMQAAQFQDARLRVTVEAPERLPPLSAAVEAAAYRIVVEALTNVTRHAQAETCHIRLVLGDALDVEVLDDGRGLPAEHTAGVGLVSIRERTAELGGRCLVERVAGGGTRVWACLPVSSPAGAATPDARGQA